MLHRFDYNYQYISISMINGSLIQTYYCYTVGKLVTKIVFSKKKVLLRVNYVFGKENKLSCFL